MKKGCFRDSSVVAVRLTFQTSTISQLILLSTSTLYQVAQASRRSWRPPNGSGPYYGLRLLPEVAVDGFVLGAITDFEQFPGLESGDAFVQAPDGSRAGLEWRMSNESYLLMMAPPTADRWGVWMAGFIEPMDSVAAALINPASIKPGLEERWRNWHEARADGHFEAER